MKRTQTDTPGSAGSPWERRQTRSARLTAGVTALLAVFLALIVQRAEIPLLWSLPLAPALAGLAYYFSTRKIRRRREILSQPFPAPWEAVLQKDVVFFRALAPESQARFRRELQIFLGEKRVTGIKTQVDTTTLVLAGASAVIPIFGFPEWEWDQISEVLIYPSRFDDEFQHGKGPDQSTLGMVGTGFMNRLMILSKPDLIQGFRNPGDKLNVGLHEFAHLVDKSDGTIDGLPQVGLDREAIGPWVELVRRKMQEIAEGDSDIRRYALTNEAEFFAVATEYFFERPDVMKRKHPALHAAMHKIFNQDLGGRARQLAEELKRGRRKFGRNSPCPCGSGLKYKKCCLAAKSH